MEVYLLESFSPLFWKWNPQKVGFSDGWMQAISFWRELNLIPKTSTAQEWPLCWNGLGADTVWDPNNALPTLRTTVMLKIMGRWWHLGAVPWVFVDAGMLVFSTLKMEECHNFWPETSRIQGSTHRIISGQFLTMSSRSGVFCRRKHPPNWRSKSEIVQGSYQIPLWHGIFKPKLLCIRNHWL